MAGQYLLIALMLLSCYRCQGELEDVSEQQLFVDVNYNIYSEKVLASNDSWILVFYADEIGKQWETLAKEIRGLAWIGVVDVDKNKELLTKLGSVAPKIPIARVYPFGSKGQKLSEWQDVQDWKEAKRFALKSLPTDIPVLSEDQIHQFIIDSHKTDTPRYPTVFLTDSFEIPPVLRAIKVRFQRYFNLGLIVNPDKSYLTKLGFDSNKLPTLPTLALLIKEGEEKRPTLSKQNVAKTDKNKKEKSKTKLKPIVYNKAKFGEFTYAKIMQFFFSAHHQFHYVLPKGRYTDKKTVGMMDDVIKIEEERFDELFGRKIVSKAQKAEQEKKKTGDDKSSEPTGKCPFGFDKLADAGKKRP